MKSLKLLSAAILASTALVGTTSVFAADAAVEPVGGLVKQGSMKALPVAAAPVEAAPAAGAAGGAAVGGAGTADAGAHADSLDLIDHVTGKKLTRGLSVDRMIGEDLAGKERDEAAFKAEVKSRLDAIEAYKLPAKKTIQTLEGALLSALQAEGGILHGKKIEGWEIKKDGDAYKIAKKDGTRIKATDSIEGVTPRDVNTAIAGILVKTQTSLASAADAEAYNKAVDSASAELAAAKASLETEQNTGFEPYVAKRAAAKAEAEAAKAEEERRAAAAKAEEERQALMAAKFKTLGLEAETTPAQSAFIISLSDEQLGIVKSIADSLYAKKISDLEAMVEKEFDAANKISDVRDALVIKVSTLEAQLATLAASGAAAPAKVAVVAAPAPAAPAAAVVATPAASAAPAPAAAVVATPAASAAPAPAASGGAGTGGSSSDSGIPGLGTTSHGGSASSGHGATAGGFGSSDSDW